MTDYSLDELDRLHAAATIDVSSTLDVRDYKRNRDRFTSAVYAAYPALAADIRRLQTENMGLREQLEVHAAGREIIEELRAENERMRGLLDAIRFFLTSSPILPPGPYPELDRLVMNIDRALSPATGADEDGTT